jgi:hypothetical protein
MPIRAIRIGLLIKTAGKTRKEFTMKNLEKVLRAQNRRLGAVVLTAAIAFLMTACAADDNVTTGLEGGWKMSSGPIIQFSGSTFKWYTHENNLFYEGTFSISGSIITLDEVDEGRITCSFQLSGNTLVLSGFSLANPVYSINGTYVKQ